MLRIIHIKLAANVAAPTLKMETAEVGMCRCMAWLSERSSPAVSAAH